MTFGRIGRTLALIPILALAAPSSAQAQTMEEVLNGLFVFSSGGDPLFLAGSTTNGHGNHFIPSEQQSNGSLLAIFNDAIAANVSNFPLSSTVSSQTFKFVGGVPTATSNSFGPIFAERAQTLGRGRFDVGMNYSSISFDHIRGTPLDAVSLNFVHENSDGPGCSEFFGDDCSKYGVPGFEHDVIQLDMDLQIRAKIYAFMATLGVTDWMDIGFAVPVVEMSIDGTSQARIIPSNINDIAHRFGGTATDPQLNASSVTRGTTTGVGDVAARIKARVLDSDETSAAFLATVRLPTGRKEDFLGSGETSVHGMFIGSATLGDFSPHVNLGYVGRLGETDVNGFTYAAGFDQKLSDWATFAVDILGEFKLGDSLMFPGAVTFDPPITRTVDRVNIANIRDDIVDGSLGFKFRTDGGLILWTNALLSLNNGGMRSGIVGSFGIQFGT